MSPAKAPNSNAATTPAPSASGIDSSCPIEIRFHARSDKRRQLLEGSHGSRGGIIIGR
jgi:hypothetical protein